MRNKSIWLLEEGDEYPRLKGDIVVDVAIAGGGIAGLTAAYMLKKAGLKVAVVEANKIAEGVSGHTTGKITSQHDLIYNKLSQKSDIDTAKLYARANQDAIERIEQIINQEKIECNFLRQDAYIYTCIKNKKKDIEQEAKAALNMGIKSELTKETGLPFEVELALRFKNQAMFHPVKYLRSLAKKINGDGSFIFEKSRVTKVDNALLKTNGGSITADNVIIATHFPIMNTPGLYFVKMYQHRSYLVALEGARALDGMYISYEKDGKSFRMFDKYLLVCGADHKTGKEGSISHYDMLEEYAKLTFPGANIFTEWSAQDCLSPDIIPYIGRYSSKTPKIYVATGFAKWGMTGGTVAGIILSDMILERENEFEEIFSPQREKTLLTLGNVAVNVSEVTGEYARGILKKTPVCTHLKCKLTWNIDEKSWDCPCHGSRFNEHGSIIEAPAVLNLKTQ